MERRRKLDAVGAEIARELEAVFNRPVGIGVPLRACGVSSCIAAVRMPLS